MLFVDSFRSGEARPGDPHGKGTLEAVLHKGGFTKIDSLTLAGTFGGDDLNYLRERGGVVGGLSYLNLTDAVLT